MIRLILAAFVVSFVVGMHGVQASVPPRAGQPHPDIFPCGTGCDLQKLSPVVQKAKTFRTVSYRLTTATGCTTGTVPADLQFVAADMLANVKLALVRNDVSPDFTVFINCGNEQIRQCGSINIFCLPYGWPRVSDVSISDIINTYPPVSRRSILCHEICGHAIGGWNEQYCVGSETSGVCKGLPQFTPTPNWADVMNTGVESRHDLSAIEVERWDRTMYPVLLDCVAVGYDPCTGRWYQVDGWSYDPSTGVWHNPGGVAEWTPCNADRIRYNLMLQMWLTPGSGVFAPSRGFWSFSPAC